MQCQLLTLGVSKSGFLPKKITKLRITTCDLFKDSNCQRLGVPALLDPQDMAESSVVDRLSILTYLSSLYHVLAEEGKERKVSEDSGVSVEEEESVCSSCSSSSGYDSPTKVEQEEEEEEAEKKADKVVRRGGAEARRGSRRLVKSMIEVGDERETPFRAALRKFNSLAKSQTQLGDEPCRERSLESSCQADESQGRASLNVRERVTEWGSRASTCSSRWEEEVEVVEEPPQPPSSLVTRATQTEEERRSAAVQTSPLKAATTQGCWGSGGPKTHQRRQSIHSRAQAFLNGDSRQPPSHIPRGTNVPEQSSLTLQHNPDLGRLTRSHVTGGAPPSLQVPPLHRHLHNKAQPAHSMQHQPQSLTVLPCTPPSDLRLQSERLWCKTPASEEASAKVNYQRMDTLQFSHRGLQPNHRSASSPQLAQRLTAYPRQAATILNHGHETAKSRGPSRRGPAMPSHPQVLSPFPNCPQVLSQGSNQVSREIQAGGQIFLRPGNNSSHNFPPPSFSTLV